MQDQQAVAEGHRLDLIVRDVKAGDAEAALQPTDFGAHLDPQFGIEVGKRLVEQKQFRVAHDGAAHRDALALTAGQLPRFAGEERLQTQQRGGFVDLAGDVARDRPRMRRPYAMLSNTDICG